MTLLCIILFFVIYITLLCINKLISDGKLLTLQKTSNSMSTNIADFFLPSNSVYDITEKDYMKVDVLLNAVKAFARSTYKSVYIIDYFRKNFLYASDSLAYICGEDKDKILEYGYDIYIKKVPEEDQKMLVEINAAGFKFFNNLPIEERTEYTISYDFHLINGGKKRLYNHCLTPMLMTEDGRMWLALCTFSPSARKKTGYVRMQKNGDREYHEYNLTKHKWEKKQCAQLSDNEREVLLMSSQGYTMNEISDRLCKSLDSIKSYKRSLFSKLGVTNIAEALSYASNYRLFDVR